MSDQSTLNAGFPLTRKARYTGYATDGTTVVNANLAVGAVLQAHAGYATGSPLASDQAGTALADNAHAYGRPTAGKRGPFGVVTGSILKTHLDAVNRQSSSTANLRDGGEVEIAVGGYCRALCYAAADYTVTNNVTLMEAVDGQNYLQPCSALQELLYANVAASAAVTSTNTETAFDKSYTLAANSLNVGDVLKIRVQGIATAAANTDTLTIKLYIGSTEIVATGANDMAANDIFVIDAFVTIRTIGTSGTLVGAGMWQLGTPSVVQAAADMVGGDFAASATINTQTTNAITVKATWSTTDTANSCRLDILQIEKVGTSSIGRGPCAVMAEDATLNTTAALKKVYLLQHLL